MTKFYGIIRSYKKACISFSVANVQIFKASLILYTKNGGVFMDKEALSILFEKWCKKLRITPNWDAKIEFIEDRSWRKTGDFKVDCDDKKVILMLNIVNPKQENLEEVIVHELLHLKMYPLDQITESLIKSNFKEGSTEYNFAYTQFFTALEQTVEELTKCYLLEFGDNKNLSYGRCKNQKSFDDIFNGLKSIE